MGCANSVAHGDGEPSFDGVNNNKSKRNQNDSFERKHAHNNQQNKSSLRKRLSKTKDPSVKSKRSNGSVSHESEWPFGLITDDQYEEIIASLKPGKLFEDPDFPADASALYNDISLPENEKDNIQWLRPQKILGETGTPQLITDGVTRDDIKQGILGDCWFLSSCAAVSQRGRMNKKIIPENQVLSGPNYKGIVRFKFWRYGDWVQVAVDDRLPTIKGKLIYGQSTDSKEFWVALLEKAYAKLHGSYENLEGGITMDALVDLTGGLAERYELTQYNPSIYKRIERAYQSGAFIACSRKGDWKNSTKADANGLIPGHAYTITDAATIEHQRGVEKLVRVRNPWGDATEWRGSWSDNDVNWEWVDEETKMKIQQESKDDGEFWMSFKDFYHQFGDVTICLLGPDFDGDGVSDVVGHMETIRGEWVVGKTAGGSRNSLSSFTTNDQYLLTITEPDDFNVETDDADCEGKSNIVIALMQEHRYSRQRVKSYQIGFFIYKATNECKLSLQHFRYTPDVAKTNCFINYREVSGRFELDPGQYVIIPTTFLENCRAHFMLRVFGEKKFSLKGPLPPETIIETEESCS